MKKILSGMFYRLFRGFELWALIALMLFASLYFYYVSVGSVWFNRLMYSDRVYEEDYKGEHYLLDSSNIRQYCFENLGVSAFDVYRSDCETIPDSASKTLYQTYNCAVEELGTLFSFIGTLHLVPCLLICIFIPVFFGRMFSDGTLKNLIACGHSKGKIFMASMLLTVLLDLVMFGMNLASLVFWCLIYKWKPPVYLPVVIPIILLVFFLVITISVICLAILFASSKKAISFVAGFILVIYMLIPGSTIALSFIGMTNAYIDPNSEDYILLRSLYEGNGSYNGVETRFDLSSFTLEYYYEGRELNFYADEYFIDPVVDSVLRTVIYADPAMVPNLERYSSTGLPPYMVVRDGLAAVNAASEAFWIIVSSGIGFLVFRKREIHC